MATRKTTRKAAGKPKKGAAKKPARAAAGPKSKPKRATAKKAAAAPAPQPVAAPRPPPPPPEPEVEEPVEAEEPPEGGIRVSFDGVLTPHQPAGTFVPLSREHSEAFPGRGLVRVKGTVGGIPIQSSLMPMGDGTRSLGVHKATLESGGLHPGDTVKVVLQLDTSSREVVVPKDFAEALEKSPAARRTFENYAFSHRKEYVNWIEEAKQPETRLRRIDQAVRMIEANEKLS